MNINDLVKMAFESTADDGTLSTDEKANELCIAYQKLLAKKGILQNCLNCINWQSTIGKEGCTLARPQQIPPPEVIAYGCKSWEDDIPF